MSQRTLYECDVCGKVSEDPKEIGFFEINLLEGDAFEFIGDLYSERIDLCKDCAKKIRDNLSSRNKTIDFLKLIKDGLIVIHQGETDKIYRDPGFYPIWAHTIDYNFTKACTHCSNNPANGGSGNCNCTLNLPTVYC